MRAQATIRYSLLAASSPGVAGGEPDFGSRLPVAGAGEMPQEAVPDASPMAALGLRRDITVLAPTIPAISHAHNQTTAYPKTHAWDPHCVPGTWPHP